MAEQVSRRAHPVTSAGFEQPFETHLVRFGIGGLNLKDSLDAMEGWARLTNAWQESEAEVTARPGLVPLATHGVAAASCHSIRKLRQTHQVPTPTSFTRFWGINQALHIGAEGATTPVVLPPGGTPGFSGFPLTLLPHRPTLSGESWMFVADYAKMVKVRSDGLALPIGLPAPEARADADLDTEYSRAFAMFDGDGTDPDLWTPVAGVDSEGTAVGAPLPGEDTEGPIAGTAGYFVTNPTVDDPVDGYDSWWGVGVSRDMTVLDRLGGGGTTEASDQDICHVWMKLSHPELVAEIRLYVVISETFAATVLPGRSPADTDPPGANTDAYVKAFRPNDYVQFVQARTAQVEAAEQARIYALRDKDSATRGYDDTRPSWPEARAQADPARARSFQLGLASHQWFGYGQVGSAFRRGDFQRIGSTQDRDWSTVTGLIIYVRTTEDCDGAIGIGVDDWYLTGGFGPDTVEPGMQMYDYRCTHYDPRTGAESNGSLEMDPTTPGQYLDSVRRRIVVSPPAAYGDPAMRQRFYRRGGSLIDDWYFCGENDSDGGTFPDDLSDAELAAAPTLPVDHYQPVPTVRAFTEAEGGVGSTKLGQPIPCLWGPIEGMLMGCGDPHRPGHVYFSMPDAPDHWSAFGNVEVCAPSEELMNGCVLGHQAFVFSHARGYFLYPNLSGEISGVTAAPSLCTRGLLGRWGLAVGPGGVAYFVAEDGVFATQGGPETWLSEAINPLFYGSYVNGYRPIAKTPLGQALLRLTVWENCLYFQYFDQGDEDTHANPQLNVLVYSILQKFWRHYWFQRPPAVVQGEDEDILLVGGYETGKSYTHAGTDDDGQVIPCLIRTGSASGNRREEKLFGDIFLDADVSLATLALRTFLDEEETVANSEITFSGPPGRQRYLFHPFGDLPQKGHSIAAELFWQSTAAPTLFQLGYGFTLQPDLTLSRVTNWDDLNSADEVWLTGVTLDCDTYGLPKTICVERDFNGAKTEVTRFDVTASNRHKFKFSWPAVPAHMVRLRPDPNDIVPWLLYRADWIYVSEPPRISAWDIHFENEWDQYYTGLDLYCDTGGLEKHIEVWVDNVRLADPATGLSYWPVTTTGRAVVHLTLPWGRGHVFRFVAIDQNPGLLYTHRWHLQPEPSEQANWNQNFSVLGTRADKWLKAIVFECDTYNQPKTVNVEVDGTVVEQLTVTADGRRVVQLALNGQRLGRVWRIFPVDAHPGRLYSVEPIFDEEPFCFTRWETQETNHGLPGWFYPLYAHITLKATSDVQLVTQVQHNQEGGVTQHSYVIPATGGQKQRRFLNGFHAVKGVLIKYVLVSNAPFYLYRDETTVVVQPWGAPRAITVQPFGNDDQDPSRPMTHAVLAAQASGGSAPSTGGPS